MPLYGSLGTVRPDDTVQVNPMWFEFDGVNARVHPLDSSSEVPEPAAQPGDEPAADRSERSASLPRGSGALVQVVPDPEGAFYLRLARRYGSDDSEPPADSPDRVVLVMDVVRRRATSCSRASSALDRQPARSALERLSGVRPTRQPLELIEQLR